MHVTHLFPDSYGKYFILKLAFCVAAEFRARAEQIGVFLRRTRGEISGGALSARVSHRGGYFPSD